MINVKEHGSAEVEPLTHRDWLGLTLVLGVCLALRLTRLTWQAVWYDEATLAHLAQMGVVDRLLTTMADENLMVYGLGKALLVGLLLQGWMALVGVDEAALRILFVAIGCAALVPFFLLARRLAGSRGAWAAVSLLALSPFHIYYSQQISEYGLIFLLTSVSMLLWLRRCRSRDYRSASWVAGVNLLGLLCHPLFVFVPMVQLVGDLAPGRRRLGAARWLNLLPLLLFVAYAVVLKLGSEHSLVPLTMGWIPPLYWRSPLEMLQLLLHGPITHGELLDGGLAAGNIIIQRIFLGIVGVLALVGLAALVRRPDLPGRRFYFVWLLLPPGTLAAYSLLVDSIWVPRYATTMLPLLFICVGAGVSALARHERPLSHLFLGVLIFLSLHSAVLQLSMIPSGSIREAVAILKKETSENDMDGIICAPDRVVLPFAFYWDGDLLGWAQAARQVKERISPELFWLTNDLNNPAFRLERRPGFEDWRGKQDRIWLLTIRDWPGDRQTPHLRKYLADRMRETEQGLYRYSGLDLLLYEPK